MTRFIRTAGPDDLGALMDLAKLSGFGFTSLPPDENILAARLALSTASFSSQVAPTDAWYTIMLEDSDTGTIDGVAAVRAAVGIERPHFSFRVLTMAQSSSAIGARFDHQALVLVNECTGWTEVGSLFLRPEARSGGSGGLLARSRYMLIGADASRFSTTVMAELRGWHESDGGCPFWDGVASKFYRLPFSEADKMVTGTDGQFILDLAPRHPIYVELLDEATRSSIGKCHQEGEGAQVMLRKEGFQYNDLIDIFDGGPTVTCPRDGIASIARAQELYVRIGPVVSGTPHLLSTSTIENFRAINANAQIDGDNLILERETADLLRLTNNMRVRATPLNQRMRN